MIFNHFIEIVLNLCTQHLKLELFREKRLTPLYFRPNIRPPLKRPYRLEA